MRSIGGERKDYLQKREFGSFPIAIYVVIYGAWKAGKQE
jgi:hypothetical protein